MVSYVVSRIASSAAGNAIRGIVSGYVQNSALRHSRSLLPPSTSRGTRRLLLAAALSLLAFPAPRAFAASPPDFPKLFIPQPAFGPDEIAIIVNTSDPLSVRVAEYYRRRRRIPEANVIAIAFPPGIKELSPRLFKPLKARVDARTPRWVQAYVLTWAEPYRVDCMSITTAFAAGFNRSFCASGCRQTRTSPYFNSDSHAPFDDFGWRPTMALAGRNYEAVVRLIERGIASDHTFPTGTGYLLSTSDEKRNSRAAAFPAVVGYFDGLWDVRLVDADLIKNRKDVMFYFTGQKRVGGLATNRFRPGAIGDHLTSSGGRLTDSRQMSSLRGLEAGAPGSSGAVVEPCNFPQKFPHPGIVMEQYLRGASLIEAYW